MLWMLVILLIGGLSFVLFHKPHVNSMGAGWLPPEKRVAANKPQLQLTDGSEDAVTVPVPKAPAMPDTFDFNDLFGGTKNQGPTDRPNA